MAWYTEVVIIIITFIILYCLRTFKLLLYFFRTFRSFPKFKDFTLPNVFVTFFVPEHFCVNFRRKPCLALFRTNSKDIFWTFHRAGYAHCGALGVKAHFPQFQTLPSSQLTQPEKCKESDGLCLLRDQHRQQQEEKAVTKKEFHRDSRVCDLPVKENKKNRSTQNTFSTPLLIN